MSVAPSNLLQLTPEVKSASFVTQAKQVDTGSDGESDFHKVYVKQHEAKPAERGEHASRSANRDRKTDDKRDAADKSPADDTTSQVADSGNELPDDDAVADADSDESTEGPLDPLALMDLLNQQPLPQDSAPQSVATVPDSQGTVGAELLAGLVGQGAAQQTAVNDPAPATPDEAQADPLGALSLQGLALDASQTTGVQSRSEVGKGTPVTDAAADASGADFAAAMESMGEQLKLDGQGADGQASLDDKLADFDLAAADGQGAELRSESLADRLHSLGQGMAPGAAAAAAQRGALVPGQPLAMNSSGFSEAVVDRVMWMSSQNLKSAEIQLDPGNLGRLEVRVHLDQDQTQVTFSSTNQAVRDTLESQMHKLRDMFSQQGMNLADVNVSDQSLSRGWQGQQAGADGQQSRGGHGTAADAGGTAEEDDLSVGNVQASVTALDSGRGLVDYYA